MSDRYDLARRCYVYDKKPLVQIAQELEVDIFTLKREATDGNWLAQREAAAAIARDDDASNPMAGHVRIADTILRNIEVLREQLMDPDLEPVKARLLRGKIESMRSLAEATNSTIKIHREAAGLKPGTPSSGETKEVDGITYEVVLPPANFIQTSTTG